MKAFTLMGSIFAVFLLILGFTSRNSAGKILSNAVIAAGLLVLLFVAAIRVISYIKEKREGEK